MHGLSGKCKWSVIFTLFLSVICVLIFCEYLIYYPAILHCSWSDGLSTWAIKLPALIIMYCTFIPDREGQMERAFRTALGLLQPEVVFILGDIFDLTTMANSLNNTFHCIYLVYVTINIYLLFVDLFCGQHYPVYHLNDAECTGKDVASPEECHQVFHEQYDMLYQETSQRLPLILSGHTHSACKVVHDNKHPEISVPSFSWRNCNNPSFILRIGTQPPTPCRAPSFLLEESSVMAIYCATGMVVSLMLMAHLHFSKSFMLLATSLMGKHKGL
uniref:Calcineurin-like phosphoesterase domain-containing protein n=1 Tax=Oncorhynchus mykiss TaxID=8022 RepID=A0A8C7UFI7_ONCMY